MSARILLLVLLCGCQPSPPDPPQRVGHYLPPQTQGLLPAALPGGASTVVALRPGSPLSLHALSQPSANLSATERALFAAGNSFFTSAWVAAPASTAARDGLGPLFNAAACQDCHLRDGRGQVPGQDGPLGSGAVVRIGDLRGEALPVYGRQIQTRALPGFDAEAEVQVQWQTRSLVLPDGSEIALRSPQLQFSKWGYGIPQSAFNSSLRVAPAMTGLGLLEAIPAADIQSYAVTQARQWPRLSGRPALGAGGLGRFGWKAGKLDVEEQALHAAMEDMGLTSARFGTDNCTAQQTACRDAPDGGMPELAPRIAEALTFYARHLAPVARRDHARTEVGQGAVLFQELGCAACHKPDWQTDPAATSIALQGQQIWPYTDLLLHDMGEGLADGLAEGAASGAEWRTPPLWGLAHVKTVGGERAGYLHDGRARSLQEAIAWHGGEAQFSRDAWLQLPASKRRLVIRFLASL